VKSWIFRERPGNREGGPQRNHRLFWQAHRSGPRWMRPWSNPKIKYQQSKWQWQITLVQNGFLEM